MEPKLLPRLLLDAFFDALSQRRNLENLILVEAKLRFLLFPRNPSSQQGAQKKLLKMTPKCSQKVTPEASRRLKMMIKSDAGFQLRFLSDLG